MESSDVTEASMDHTQTSTDMHTQREIEYKKTSTDPKRHLLITERPLR
jgi:hypothetical protein